MNLKVVLALLEKENQVFKLKANPRFITLQIFHIIIIKEARSRKMTLFFFEFCIFEQKKIKVRKIEAFIIFFL